MPEEKVPVPTPEESIFNPRIERLTALKSEPLFDSIVGYGDVKRLFQLSLSSEMPVHLLLVGPPASAKTLFMLECMKLERSYFTLGSHSTKSGMKDQTALLSLMETGILAETKFQKTRNTHLKTWVFATSNSTERMLTPLLSRFVVLRFKRYSYGSFQEVCTHILGREGVTSDIAAAIAEAVWTKLKSKDIRDCIKIGRLAKTKDDVEWIAQTLRAYK